MFYNSLPAVQLCGYVIERVLYERKKAGFSSAIEWIVFLIGCLGQLAVFGTVAVSLYFGDSGNVLVGQSLTSESYDGWKIQGILVGCAVTLPRARVTCAHSSLFHSPFSP